MQALQKLLLLRFPGQGVLHLLQRIQNNLPVLVEPLGGDGARAFDLGGAPWESDDYVEQSPHNYADKFATPCLVITGEKDYRVPYTQSLEFFTALQKQGVPSRLVVFENDGHWPSWTRSMPLYYNAHLEWFHKYLGGDPAPWDSGEMVRNRGYGDDSSD